MDDAVRAAMAKWPNVPACYDWLALDGRGRWRLNGDPVRHAGLAGFLNRNYQSDDTGNWYCQNGPQRVFVELAVTPWVLRLDGMGRLETHTGREPERLDAALLDETGRLLLEFALDDARQIGVIDDHDMAALLETVTDEHGKAADEESLLALMAGKDVWLTLNV